MVITARRKWLIGSAAALLVVLLFLGKIAGWVIAGQVRSFLGERGSIESARVALDGTVVLRGLDLAGPSGTNPPWPAERSLRVERAVLRPEWGSLTQKDIRFRSVLIDRAYLAVFRTRSQGTQVVPTLLTKDPAAEPGKKWDGSVHIAQIEVEDSVIEYFDEKASTPPMKLRMEQLNAKVGDLLVPALSTQVAVDLTSVIKGEHNDGQLAVQGWTRLDNRESSLKTTLKGLDLTAVQAYVNRSSDLGMQQGLLDLDMQYEVRGRRLDAPGRARLHQLQFVAGKGAQGVFLGMPKIALIKAMQSRGGDIDLKFHLNGNIDDPKFALNEALPMRLAVGMAETLGLSVKGVVTGVGTLGGKGLDAVGGAAKGIGGVFGGMFGGKKEDSQPSK